MHKEKQSYLLQMGFTFVTDKEGNTLYQLGTLILYEPANEQDAFYNTKNGEQITDLMTYILTK